MGRPASSSFEIFISKSFKTNQLMSEEKTVLAIFAHPDDIEFCAAGTLLLLAKQGWNTHYLNLSSGDLGSFEYNQIETQAIRHIEAKAAAEILGAQYHDSICNDMGVTYTVEHVRKVTSLIRKIQPDIILTHSPNDYMEDHQDASRIAVSAAFTRGMPNFEANPKEKAYGKDVTLYHAMPHGLRDPLRQRLRAGLYVDTESVHSVKREALAAHKSQKSWLDATQGMDSYLVDMDRMSKAIGELSGKYNYAEGWRRHLHLGFSSIDQDPLRDALPDHSLIDEIYEQGLETPS